MNPKQSSTTTKLALIRTTLRMLTSDELDGVHGGATAGTGGGTKKTTEPKPILTRP